MGGPPQSIRIKYKRDGASSINEVLANGDGLDGRGIVEMLLWDGFEFEPHDSIRWRRATSEGFRILKGPSSFVNSVGCSSIEIVVLGGNDLWVLDCVREIEDAHRNRATEQGLLRAGVTTNLVTSLAGLKCPEVMIKAIQGALEPYESSEYLRSTMALLFHGPPGTGKTFAISQTLKMLEKEGAAVLFSGPASGLLHGIVGESPKLIAKYLSIAKQNPSRLVVVFVDEVDLVASKRGQGSAESGGGAVNGAILNMFLPALDYKRNLLFIFSTNLRENLDLAFCRSGRIGFDTFVPPMTFEERTHCIRSLCTELKIENLNSARLAVATCGYPYGALLELLSRDGDPLENVYAAAKHGSKEATILQNVLPQLAPNLVWNTTVVDGAKRIVLLPRECVVVFEGDDRTFVGSYGNRVNAAQVLKSIAEAAKPDYIFYLDQAWVEENEEHGIALGLTGIRTMANNMQGRCIVVAKMDSILGLHVGCVTESLNQNESENIGQSSGTSFGMSVGCSVLTGPSAQVSFGLNSSTSSGSSAGVGNSISRTITVSKPQAQVAFSTFLQSLGPNILVVEEWGVCNQTLAQQLHVNSPFWEHGATAVRNRISATFDHTRFGASLFKWFGWDSIQKETAVLQGLHQSSNPYKTSLNFLATVDGLDVVGNRHFSSPTVWHSRTLAQTNNALAIPTFSKCL